MAASSEDGVTTEPALGSQSPLVNDTEALGSKSSLVAATPVEIVASSVDVSGEASEEEVKTLSPVATAAAALACPSSLAAGVVVTTTTSGEVSVRVEGRIDSPSVAFVEASAPPPST